MSEATSVTLCRFAFIEFATEQETEQALESSQNAKLDKKSISVQKYDMLKNAYKTKGTSGFIFTCTPPGGLHRRHKWMLHPAFILLLTLQRFCLTNT